ncbi:hypothetical protein AB1Y20_012341 [Prymnesium parvum]|uniref:Uncharacterized protein n=1 Tax=Prymnesium parvum TaxID=97485 RepID=A0AB34INU4_PRYPA|mmetsp:Transcript_26769/g.61344  ORF Transcript_26769/g.61344 Transcript_26769/m.61344 type:complete len:222 (+) Transcript_26769:41-706(+)
MALSLALAPAAFHAPLAAQPTRQMAQMSMADKAEGISFETGNKVFDPLGLADLGGEKTLAFLRHAEIKHGRVSMAAFVGYLVAANGIHFPGLCSFSESLSFEDLSKLPPLEQWSAMPFLGKAQILLLIGIIEHQAEWNVKPHYMAPGGVPGDVKALGYYFDPIGLTSKMSAEAKEKKRLSEIKNGRLAMLGITSVLIAKEIPGSIPVPIDFPAGGFLFAPF